MTTGENETLTQPFFQNVSLLNSLFVAVGVDAPNKENGAEILSWYEMPSRVIRFGEQKPYHPCLRMTMRNENWSQVIPRTSQLSNSGKTLRHEPHSHNCFLNKQGELVFLRRTIYNHNFRLSINSCDEVDENWLFKFWRTLTESVGVVTGFSR